MKKIYKHILLLAAVFSFAPLAKAQGDDPGRDIVLTKQLIGPDNDGIFTLKLESYLEANAEAKPVDVVLVLDVSGSMSKSIGEGKTRLQALKDAVQSFITVLNKNDKYFDWGADKPTQRRPNRLGNRISIVKFSGPFYGPNNNNGTANDLTEHSTISTHDSQTGNNTEVVKNLTTLSDNNTSLTSAVNDLTAQGSTASDYGMKKAEALFDETINIPANNGNKTILPFADNKVVVLFTDGSPTHFDGFWNDVAGEAINSAYRLKQKGVLVYSVGVFGDNNPGSDTNKYMNSVSSNYKDAYVNDIKHRIGYDGWGNYYNYYDFTYYSNGAGTATLPNHPAAPSGYYKTANSASELNNIFIEIAESAAARSEVNANTVATDFVTHSFKLPSGAKGVINAYTYPATGKDQWGTPTLFASTSRAADWADSEEAATETTKIIVKTTTDGETQVSVTKFNYFENWVGVGGDGEYRGNKLSIEIPIEIKDNIVGGHGLATNGDNSGLYLPDGTLAKEYEVQHTDIAVNLWIKKYGLLKGESAKFTVWRKPITGGNWEKFTDVVITGTGNIVTASENKDADVENEAPYYNMYTSPMAKLEGLSDQYYYKVEEESWSWSYTSEAETAISTDPSTEGGYLEFNPFIFVNTKQNSSRKHAESIVTNDFGAGTYITVDSREFFQK